MCVSVCVYKYFWKDIEESMLASGKGGVWGTWSIFAVNLLDYIYF